MRSFPRIFIGDIDIFLTYDDSTIFEAYSEMYIFEGYRDDFSTYIEHLAHHLYSFFIISSTDIYECCQQYISDFI